MGSSPSVLSSTSPAREIASRTPLETAGRLSGILRGRQLRRNSGAAASRGLCDSPRPRGWVSSGASLARKCAKYSPITNSADQPGGGGHTNGDGDQEQL